MNKEMNEFINRETFKGLTEHVLKQKRKNIENFYNNLAEKNKNILQTEKGDIENYLEIEYRWDLSKALFNRRLTHLKQFYNYLIKCDKVLLNPCESIESLILSKSDPGIFTEEEIKRILANITDDKNGKRDRAIIELLYSTGMRMGELINLNIDDVDFTGREVFIYHGKGNKERIVPVGEAALKSVEFYLAERYNEMDKEMDSLFLTDEGFRPTKSCINCMFMRKKKKAGIKSKGNTHALRHSFASHMLKNGAPVNMIMRILGHEHIYETIIYTHIEKNDLQNVYNSIDWR